MNIDIICLTGLQLQQSLNSQRIPTLADFEIICKKNEDSFSLLICSRREIFISLHT